MKARRNEMKKLILLLVIVFFACELFSGYWVDPMVVNPDSVYFFMPDHDITWDSTGRVWVSWTSDTSYSYYDWSKVKACYYNGVEWSDPFRVSQGLDTLWWACNCSNVMTTDKNGTAWILWYFGSYPVKGYPCNKRQEDWGIEYSLFTNGVWTKPCLAESTIGAFISDAITDSTGKIWVIWTEQVPVQWYENLYTTHFDGFEWLRETVSTYMLWFSNPSFVSESTGVCAVWAYKVYEWLDSNYGVSYAHNYGGGWGGFQSIYSDSILCRSPSVTIDSAGRLWVVWEYGTYGHSDLWSKYRESGVWSNLKIITSDTTNEYSPSIETDGYGKTWLACTSNKEGSYHIYVSYLEDTTFTAFQQISSQPGYDPKLGCDMIGNIWAIWYGNNLKNYASFYRRDTNPPRVTVIKPNGGEVYNYGEIDTIKWVAEDEDTIVWVNIYLSSDGGNSYESVSEFEINDSIYEWTIPDVTSNNCLIKITAIDKGYNAISDESDSFFTILGTGIYEESEKLAKKGNVKFQVFPNPFTSVISIKCSGISERQKVNLSIYDVSGRLMRKLMHERISNSHFPVFNYTWDRKDNAGNVVQRGIYFIRLKVGDRQIVRKLSAL